MTDTPDTPTEQRAAEAAAIRRRWITLGEMLALLAVSISGLTLYLNWSDKQDERAEKAIASRQASVRAAKLILNARADGDDRLLLTPAAADQIVQSQTFLFPTALNIAAVSTTGEARIEARWFDNALKRARDKDKLPDNSVGDEKLPVFITTRFVVNGEAREDRAIYDIGYGISGRWLSGHDVTLRGLSLVTREMGQSPATRVDARWAAVVTARN
ncbi:hypothetical protein IL54_2465 [Sphingobium sp. ba1]|jgi:hypothetical protein|uniref:hypothetical protein n=1 Tax=Sphingobium sp. ba1 TaxID=1522072 RepID=UPI000504E5F5|nr:hypothetical protein [Sphingobium sp. ba1]KFL47043.1 hypothetical protein IL54_2465 [Sphingobium sp. ba1]